MTLLASRLLLLALLVTMATSNMCGVEQCVPGSKEHGVSCCCSAGTCVEDKFDTVTEIVPGLWTINTRNDAKLASEGPAENRAVLIRVPDAQGAFLVMVNGIGLCNSSIAAIKSLETTQGQLKHVISTGDWHHVYLKDYSLHFPAASIHVPPGRIPKLDGDTYKYTEVDLEQPLPFLKPAVEVYLFKGLGQPVQWSTPRYEFFFFHPATKTLVVGDPFWYFSCEPPTSFKILMPGVEKGKISMWDMLGTSMFEDKKEGAKSAEVMLGLDFERFLSIHTELGSLGGVAPGASPSAKELVKVALTTGRGPLPSSWTTPTAVVV